MLSFFWWNYWTSIILETECFLSQKAIFVSEKHLQHSTQVSYAQYPFNYALFT